MSALKYRPEIDGLRAIAVAAVVLFHADRRWIPGGFVGVDAFFVISGYLITAILAKEWRDTGRIDFPGFYARRVQRLLPALVTMIVLVMAAAVPLLGRHGQLFEQTGQSAAASLLFLANFYFQFNSGGYFDGPAEAMPFLHLWSLSVEEQYYLLYPALLALLLKLFRGNVVRRLVVLSVLSFLLAEYWVHIHPERAFYQMPARFWELALGGIVALSAVPHTSRAIDGWLVPVGLLALLVACAFTPAWGAFPGKAALPAVAGTAMALWGIHRGAIAGRVAALLRSRPVVTLGLISYSLYLWHWPLLAVDADLRIAAAPADRRLLLCGVALALAWLSWRYVERPFRGPVRHGSGRTLGWGLAASVFSLALVWGLSRLDNVPPDVRRIADFARQDHPANMEECHFPHDAEVEALKPETCRTIPSVEPTLAVWGDSHAMAWEPFAEMLAETTGASMATATMNGCLPDAGVGYRRGPLATENCTKFNELALRWIEAGRVHTVVVALRWPMGGVGSETPVQSVQVRLDGLESAFQRLRRVPRILLIGPLPLLRYQAPACISLGWEADCAVSRQEHEAMTATIWRELRALAARHPNVELIDPTDFFCDGDVCPVTRDGYSLYWDNNHISATASREFARRYLADPARYTLAPEGSLPPLPGQAR